jgi:dynein heavy chain, axonemal
MLGIVVRAEVPELERQREKLILEDAENKKQLKKIEDEILALLAAAEGNILEDETLIDTLSKSKVTSNQIMEQVKVAEKTQLKISETRAGYQVRFWRCPTDCCLFVDMCSSSSWTACCAPCFLAVLLHH